MLWVGVKPPCLKPYLPPPIARESDNEAEPKGLRPLLLSGHARLARPPETMQSRVGHVSGGTFSVSVSRGPTRNEPYAPRACDAQRERYATFRIAPVGTTPVVAYRHNAITNLRASATIPIRRVRLPTPNRVRYH
jgi:hypothetical protein